MSAAKTPSESRNNVVHFPSSKATKKSRRDSRTDGKDEDGGAENDRKQEFKSVPLFLKLAIGGEVSAFNVQLLMHKEVCFYPRFRGRYLYLFFETPKGFEPFCRLGFTGDPNGWKFSVFQSRSKRYEPPSPDFPGAQLFDGTVAGALRVGVVACSAQKSPSKQGSPPRSVCKKKIPATLNRQENLRADQKYDASWDKGKQKVWDKKYEEWEKRDWPEWLKANLSFPFQVERNDDDDDAYFTDVADQQPFRLGHTMTVLALADEDDMYGIIIKVREGRKIGYVPLCDTEVVSRDNKNFWPVREYAIWFANR